MGWPVRRTRPAVPPSAVPTGLGGAHCVRREGSGMLLRSRVEAAPVRLVAGRLLVDGRVAGDPGLIRAALADWYTRAGRRWTRGRLQPWAARMDVPEPEVRVRDLGYRWGSYRAGPGNGVVSLHWATFQLPHTGRCPSADKSRQSWTSWGGASGWATLRRGPYPSRMTASSMSLCVHRSAFTVARCCPEWWGPSEDGVPQGFPPFRLSSRSSLVPATVPARRTRR
ncbi:YgjP-like metallopeptidase domain-containing protein [Streptomyces olivaceoviridis]|uniref:YgjP-like metallopeptidase domain-containing protein n=1 Tax=Streptomyces olivaceoviridis TaxID=1921 RepID=UPI0027E4D908|nr:YgjP-like metallopeptidase domain-containing protein [Streptomyces olivaceoviridis]